MSIILASLDLEVSKDIKKYNCLRQVKRILSSNENDVTKSKLIIECILEKKNKIKEQMKDYYQKNKKELTEYKKEYYENNKEVLKEYKKVYREKNKDRIKEQDKIYREKHKDRRKKYNKIYRENQRRQNE